MRSTDSGDALALAANEVACCLGPLLFQPEIRGKQGVQNLVVVRAVRTPANATLRNELKETGVTVTCLMPGATETEFFERADMMDTKVGTMKKDDPADVAKTGFDAMMRGAGDVVAGWQNKLQTAIASVTPAGLLAEQHRRQAKPGTAG